MLRFAGLLEIMLNYRIIADKVRYILTEAQV